MHDSLTPRRHDTTQLHSISRGKSEHTRTRTRTRLRTHTPEATPVNSNKLIDNRTTRSTRRMRCQHVRMSLVLMDRRRRRRHTLGVRNSTTHTHTRTRTGTHLHTSNSPRACTHVKRLTLVLSFARTPCAVDRVRPSDLCN